MAKRKKRKVSSPSKGKKKKDNPVSVLMREHPELTRETAKEIAESGLSFGEWKDAQERKREERRRANQERIVAMICSQHADLSPEQAREIVERGTTPEEYKEELRQQRIRERRQSRGRGRGGPSRGFRRGGGGGRPPGKKKVEKKRVSKKKLMRQQAVDDILSKYPSLKDRAVAGQIASGRLTYEQWLENKSKPKFRKRRPSHRSEEEHNRAQSLREERVQALQERVERESHLGNRGDAFFEQQVEEQTVLHVLRFHKQSFTGSLLKFEPFRLFMKTPKNPNIVLTKRFCSALFQEEDAEKVLTQCHVSLKQRAFRQIPHHEPSMRYQIDDELLREGEPIWVMLHEGVQFEGRLVWADRFQFLVSLPEGGNIFVFRHGVHQAFREAPEGDDEVVSFREFAENSPDLPNVHPKELPTEDVFVPVQFNDYSVKDNVFKKYLESFDKGSFKFEPIYVRREGDSYVLVDGYRRWVLAKEKGVDSIPIVVM